jgi:eukaryotic-like serine/threonine-protein kinase
MSTTTLTAASASPDQVVGGYRLVRKLGQGGMGEVWVGEHQRLDRQGAVKLLLPSWTADEAVLERFFIEARATSRIRHPGIVEIVDCGVTPEGRAYIVMELLVGSNVREFVGAAGHADLKFIVGMAQQVASAVGAAHAQKIVHRDLKPDNIFLVGATPGAAHEQPVQAKVLDFGIAKLIDRESDTGLTGTGVLVGTPAYMSPEQSRGRGLIDHRTDIYSLGCILFELAAGRQPFLQQGIGELIAARLMEDAPTLRSVVPNIPESFDRLVNSMLVRDPDARIQTMAEVEEALKAIAVENPTFISSPAVAAVGRTAFLTPDPGNVVGATRALDSSPHRKIDRTTFSHAAGQVTSTTLLGRNNRIGIGAAVAVVILGAAVIFWFTRPSSTTAPVSHAATVAPVVVVPPPPVKSEPVVAAPDPVVETAAAVEPAVAPLQEIQAKVLAPAAPVSAVPRDPDALADPSQDEKPALRRKAKRPSRSNKVKPAGADLDALAD